MSQQPLTIEGKMQFDSFIHIGHFDVYHPSAHYFTPCTPLHGDTTPSGDGSLPHYNYHSEMGLSPWLFPGL